MIAGKPIASAVSVGFMNQAVTSGTNFLLGVYLLQIVGALEYGTYGILYSCALVLIGLGNSIILEQMTVMHPDRPSEEASGYEASALIIISVTSACALAAVCISLAFALYVGIISFKSSTLIVSVVIFAGTYLHKEFFARISYTHHREARALRINIVMSISLAIFIFAVQLLDYDLSASVVILLYACSAFVAALWGYFELMPSLSNGLGLLNASLRELWFDGKWALFSDVTNSCRQQGHIILTAVIVGPAGVALVNGAKLFVTPIMLVAPSLSQIFLARLVTLRSHDPLRLISRGTAFSTILGASVGVYAIVLWGVYPLVYSLLIGDALVGLDILVVGWVIVSFANAMRYGLEATYKALRRFKLLARFGMVVAPIALVSTLMLLKSFGPAGAVFGLCVAEGVLFGLLVLNLRTSTAIPRTGI